MPKKTRLRRGIDSFSDDDLIERLVSSASAPKKRVSPPVSRNDYIPLALRSPGQHDTGMAKGGGTRREFHPELLARSPGMVLHPRYATQNGVLFEGDCLDYLPRLKSGLADTIFADPPFNLGKIYGRKTVDSRTDSEYVEWCQRWLTECVRILAPGGAFFVYNLPKWNLLLGAHLMGLSSMQFRHAIAIEMKSCLPIPGRLYPAHYSLLYFTKGKPKAFRRLRTPIETCRHCGGEIRDYGGHRGAMNPLGVNLKDVWTDIPPVRHWKFKNRDRRANALSTKVLDRVVEITTQTGDIVLDPFGGSGTTYAVCESRGRRWVGIELDFCDEIVDRLESGRVKHHRNDDKVDEPRADLFGWSSAAD